MSESANSKNANVTLKVFIHPPDFGIFFNTEGNIAKSEKGNASAIAKPSMPIVGASKDLPAASTSRVPMIGPVHEKETMTKVNAMSMILRKPEVLLDLAFSAVDHELGKVISNAPKNDAANTTNIRKKMMFTTALVLSAFNADAPKISVISRPNPTYINMILSP